jgi:hypothetical protein
MDTESWRDKICQKVGGNFTQEEWDSITKISVLGMELDWLSLPYRITCPQWQARGNSYWWDGFWFIIGVVGILGGVLISKRWRLKRKK